jgi:hypothetical protein
LIAMLQHGRLGRAVHQMTDSQLICTMPSQQDVAACLQRGGYVRSDDADIIRYEGYLYPGSSLLRVGPCKLCFGTHLHVNLSRLRV